MRFGHNGWNNHDVARQQISVSCCSAPVMMCVIVLMLDNDVCAADPMALPAGEWLRSPVAQGISARSPLYWNTSVPSALVYIRLPSLRFKLLNELLIKATACVFCCVSAIRLTETFKHCSKLVVIYIRLFMVYNNFFFLWDYSLLLHGKPSVECTHLWGRFTEVWY